MCNSPLTDYVYSMWEDMYDSIDSIDRTEWVDQFFGEDKSVLLLEQLHSWTEDQLELDTMNHSNLKKVIINSINWHRVRDLIFNYLDHQS